MKDPDDSKHPPEQDRSSEEETRPGKKERKALELGEEAEHSIGPKRERLMEKVKQEGP